MLSSSSAAPFSPLLGIRVSSVKVSSSLSNSCVYPHQGIRVFSRITFNCAHFKRLNFQDFSFLPSLFYTPFQSYILTLLSNIVTELGFAERATDDLTTLENRMQVLAFACKLGHQDCIDNAVELFQRFKQNGTK